MAETTGIPDLDVGGGLDTLNSTAVVAALTPTNIAWAFLQEFDFFLLEARLVFSAIGIIYVAAHASLRRPPSAGPEKPRKPGSGSGSKSKRRGEDDERVTQGLMLSDAILFPIMAGCMLIGLYYLIQWLQDPEIVSKFMRWYMSTVSVLSLITLYAHGLEFGTSFVFPGYWRGRDGRLRRADQRKRKVAVCDDAGNPVEPDDKATFPIPGPLGWLTWSEKSRQATWDWREVMTQHWILRIYVHTMDDEKFKIKFAHVVTAVGAVITSILYTTTHSTMLSNIMGYGLCYGSLLVLSPTDLMIGTVVLCGLFVYDIIMVFYTPYMVTVATALDVPIKLTFEAGKSAVTGLPRRSILGLGDIVLPGLFMAWTLRLDLWMHYQRKVKYEATELKIIEKDASGAIVTRTETKHREVKAPYVNVKNSWADHFWTRRAYFLTAPGELPTRLALTRFRKTYFHATVTGYILAMMITMCMLLVFKRGQPALLYLVPGVLGSVYIRALIRGELRQVWSYTEDGSIDKTDVVVDLDGEGKPLKRIGEMKDGVIDTTITKDGDKDKEKEKDGKKKDDKEAEKNKDDVESSCVDSDDSDEDKSETDVRDNKKKKKKRKNKKTRRIFLISLDAPSELVEAESKKAIEKL
ncbi:hypothetical protein N3K66_000781 [Trichothecium roseum]|uniref:Uncharacterized protein n=1 Tax=Trichothecium roseum TaxID=47278 RepID=A0ACC0VED8_9HYPO|nr:hypothetical protein N3K66_000781 [Trichothecium roseum]